jgi:hypothetical protein
MNIPWMFLGSTKYWKTQSLYAKGCRNLLNGIYAIMEKLLRNHISILFIDI